jgi:hypothetical protein
MQTPALSRKSRLALIPHALPNREFSSFGATGHDCRPLVGRIFSDCGHGFNWPPAGLDPTATC